MNVDATYTRLMKEFRWGNLNDPKVYTDYTIRRQFQVMGIRRTFTQLAEALIQRNQKTKAVEVLNKCMIEMPLWLENQDYFIGNIISQYFEAGDSEKGLELMEEYAATLNNELSYLKSTDKTLKYTSLDEYRNYLYYLNQLIGIADSNGISAFQKEYAPKFKTYYNVLRKMK